MLRKEISRLLSERMSNIYSKVTIEKNWRSQNFDFVSLKKFLGSSSSHRYNWVLKLLVGTKKSEVWEQNGACFFYYFDFEENYDVLKWKSPCI